MIVVSVYVAIVLQGISNERGRKEDANRALVQLQLELRQDSADVIRVLEEQRAIDARYTRLSRWLESSATLPADSFDADLSEIDSGNSTLFPRKATWTTMIASGQLTYLSNPALATRLANLYENRNPRLDYNAHSYDEDLNEVMRNSAPTVWNSLGKRFFSDDPAEALKLRGKLIHMHNFNRYYIELVEDWSKELSAVLREVDAHLRKD
jgi:hypothetical protein